VTLFLPQTNSNKQYKKEEVIEGIEYKKEEVIEGIDWSIQKKEKNRKNTCVRNLNSAARSSKGTHLCF
jgi:uncharacterized protein YpiB (UPF0302 family)